MALSGAITRLGLILAAGATITAAGSAAADECIVRLFPPGADDPWRVAASRLEERVRSLPSASTDCREIDVEVTGDKATVTFITRDGRHAIRDMSTPDELVPTVEALFVTLPPAPTRAEPITITPPITPPIVQPPVAMHAPIDPLPDQERHVTFLFGLEGGARFGFPGVYASPALGGFAAVGVRRWELGVRSLWSPVYTTLGTAQPDGFLLWSLVQLPRRKYPLCGFTRLP